MTKDETLSDLSEVVGSWVRHVRERRGWSVEQLADECARVGASVLTRNALYALESGRKEQGTGRRRRLITVDEFLTLACALRVYPVDLLVPNRLRDGDSYEVAPSVPTTAGRARDWIAGAAPVGESDAELHDALTWRPVDRVAIDAPDADMRVREAKKLIAPVLEAIEQAIADGVPADWVFRNVRDYERAREWVAMARREKQAAEKEEDQ